jgi:hypothetical protein
VTGLGIFSGERFRELIFGPLQLVVDKKGLIQGESINKPKNPCAAATGFEFVVRTALAANVLFLTVIVYWKMVQQSVQGVIFCGF